MRKWAYCAALWLIASNAAHVEAAEPYPRSTLVTGITWEIASHRWTASGADLWPITWHNDGALVTAWGDGVATCQVKVSFGVAAIISDEPSTVLAGRHCGPGGEGKGKIMAMTSAGGRIIARVNMQGAGSGHRVWGSSDGGRNWDRNDTVFPFSIASFVQFGQANAGAPGDYIYALESASPGLKLLRVRPTSVQNPTAYEYFSGTPTAPTWSSTRTNAKSIFTDPAGVSRPSITYVPSLNRYLLAVAHAPGLDSSGHRVGIFEAPAMYGPWQTVSYVDNFLGIRGGEFLGINFPRKWHAQDGRTLWAVFSCYHRASPSLCGVYHDRFNLMRVTLKVGETAANRPPVAGADSAETDVGKGVTIAVLANDSDPDGDALTLTAATNPPKGTATVSTDKKSIVYLPDAGYSGSDSFSYTVSDGRGGTAQGAVAVTVRNGEPVYLGCYKDQGTVGTLEGRVLDGKRTDDKTGMTVTRCASICAQATSNFEFFGVQAGYACFCEADDDKDYDFLGKADNCNIPCPGNSAQICGGNWANSVYRLP